MTFPKLRSGDIHLGGVNSWQPYTDSRFGPDFSHFSVSLRQFYPMTSGLAIGPNQDWETLHCSLQSPRGPHGRNLLYRLNFITLLQVPASCPNSPLPPMFQAWDSGPQPRPGIRGTKAELTVLITDQGVQILVSVLSPTHCVTLGRLPPHSGPRFPQQLLQFLLSGAPLFMSRVDHMLT